MGAVYQARQISLQRIVAVKILAPKHARDQEYVQRFQLEARATGKLNHPNIVAATAVGFADRYYYFAMEFVEGESLKAKIVRKGALPEDEVVRIGAAMASALSHAHEAGIIHRDVKPDNILIDTAGTAKLTDLGLAKLQEKEDGSLTKSGATVGTPHYIAPEQASGERDIDGRADVYSLGCTLYHAATGRTPFDATNAAMLMVKHLNEKIPHPQAIRPELSDEFCAVLSRMVARNREDRYTDMQEAAEDLDALAHGEEPVHGPLPSGKSNFTSSNRAPKLATSKKLMVPERGQSSRLLQAASRHGGERRTNVRRSESSNSIYAVAGTFALLTVAALGWLMLRSKSPSKDMAQETRPAPAKTTSPEKTDMPSESSPWNKNTSQKSEATPVGLEPPKADALPPGWTRIFNSRDLTGWRIDRPSWRVENGDLVGQGPGEGMGMLEYAERISTDFEVSFRPTRQGMFHLDWSDGTQECDVLVQRADGVLQLLRFDGKKNKPLADYAMQPSERLKDVRLSVRGGQIDVFVDALLRLSYSDGRFTPGRSRGLHLFVYSGQTVGFKDLALHELTGAAAVVASVPMDAFMREVAALSPQEQVNRVMAKLKELNTDFDGACEPVMFGGKVTEVKLEGAKLADISPFRALRNLTKLQIATDFPVKSKIADLTPIKNLPLTLLQCDHAAVTDLTPLKGMKLSALYLDGNKVANLSPLEGMPLAVLQISSSSVVDLSPLKGMRLSRLRIDDCPIKDLSPLNGMPLICLMMDKVPASDLSPLKSLPLREIRITPRPEYAKTLVEISSLQTINDKGAEDELAAMGTNDSEGFTTLFHDKGDSEWTVRFPSWTLKEGLLEGQGTEEKGNAIIRRNIRLPGFFDLRFNATVGTRFQISFENKNGGWHVQSEKLGIALGVTTDQNTVQTVGDVAQVPFDGKPHEYRIVFTSKLWEIYFDGQKIIQASGNMNPGGSSLSLSIYADKSTKNVFKNMRVKPAR